MGRATPPLAALIRARLLQLQGSPPSFSWDMPAAVLPAGSHYPGLLRFLRGGARETTVSGLNGVRHARNLCVKYFRGDPRTVRSGYSATATPGGRGADAYARIVKTGADARAREATWREGVADATHLRRLLLPAADAGGEEGLGAGGGEAREEAPEGGVPPPLDEPAEGGSEGGEPPGPDATADAASLPSPSPPPPPSSPPPPVI